MSEQARHTRTAVAEAAGATVRQPREGTKPSGRQRAYIGRLACRLLELDYPETARDADALIKRLLSAVESGTATADEIPF